MSEEQSAAIFDEDKPTEEVKGEENGADDKGSDQQAADNSGAEKEAGQEAQAEVSDDGGSKREAETASEETASEEEAGTEEYEISLPEGSSLDPVHAEEIATLATELGLDGEQAQAWLNRESEIVADMLENAYTIVNEQSQAAMDEVSSEWLEQVKNDPEIGGDKLAESAELSKRFVESYFPKELQDWLDETGFGGHPEAIRGFYKAALDLGIGGDGFEKGNAAGQAKKKSDAELFYGTK